VEVRATYRIQLHGGFPLAAARALVPYLARLGVSHLYASPILRARRGSRHGYDVVDPTALDPERGTEADLEALVAALRDHGMGLVLDIVPNHMAASSENPFWEDVLTHGASSPFAAWFDVDWGVPPAPIVLPVLGDLRSRVLARGELVPTRAGGRLRIRYLGETFPLDPATLARAVPRPRHTELRTILGVLGALPRRAARDPARRELAAAALARLDGIAAIPEVRAELDAAADELARDAARFAALLADQAYRLVYWRRAAGDINYRRFFNVSDLIGVRVEHAAVFAATHARVAEWAARGWLDGVRVDHVDGLSDPRTYLDRLHGIVPGPIFVEKILARNEPPRAEWPVVGTTGYEFLNALESIFVDPAGAGAIETWYRRSILRMRAETGFGDVARAGKRRILDTWLAPDARRLGRQLWRLVRADPRAAALRPDDMTVAVAEAMICLPVYRTYVDARTTELEPHDRRAIEEALAGARRRARTSAAALELLGAMLLRPGEAAGRRAFVQRFQQTSGAVMAKGVEDTALYRWIPLVSRNEVGGDPAAPLADAAGELHAANAERAARWPRSLLSTTTHDTKWSADVRSRLDVLSEVPGPWAAAVGRWRRLNRTHRRRVRGRLAPDANTEYAFYQALVAIWPLEIAELDEPAREALHGRLRAHMEKAAREAKVRTSWFDPDADFERALGDFVDAAVAPAAGAFLRDVGAFVGRIARPGLWNALARLLVHLTAPGVPDLYQGDELWNFALTDPDNRREVDFGRREALLASPLPAVRLMVGAPEDGRLRLHVARTALALRRGDPALLAGRYTALRARGPAADHVFAFARDGGERTAVTVVPRLVLSLVGTPETAPVGALWADTALEVPPEVGPGRWRNALTDQELDGTPDIPLDAALASCPVALLVR
jgi:(1->4)-alpha-D-glucan 1-alpha-D-glucosylmutase